VTPVAAMQDTEFQRRGDVVCDLGRPGVAGGLERRGFGTLNM
jgi:hypothetical protein